MTTGMLLFGVFSWVIVLWRGTVAVKNPFPPGKTGPPPLDPEVVIPGVIPAELPFVGGAGVSNPPGQGLSRRFLFLHPHGLEVVVTAGVETFLCWLEL